MYKKTKYRLRQTTSHSSLLVARQGDVSRKLIQASLLVDWLNSLLFISCLYTCSAFFYKSVIFLLVDMFFIVSSLMHNVPHVIVHSVTVGAMHDYMLSLCLFFTNDNVYLIKIILDTT